MNISKPSLLLPFFVLCTSCLANDWNGRDAVFSVLSRLASDNDRLPLLKPNITLHVLDEEGSPIPNALIKIIDEVPIGEDRRVWTDESGTCGIRAVFRTEFGCEVLAPGYWSEGGILFSKKASCADLFTTSEGVCAPTNDYTIRMTRIRMPDNDLKIVDFQKSQKGVAWSDMMCVPVLNQECPFDLEKGDWLPPFGTGDIADMMVLAEVSEADVPSIRWRFPNPLDGAMAWADTRNFPLDYRGLRDPHEAPESGYEQEFIFHGDGIFGFDGTRENRWESKKVPVFVFRFRCRSDGNVLTGFHGYWRARTYSVEQWPVTNGPVKLICAYSTEIFVNTNRESRLLYGRTDARESLSAPGYFSPRVGVAAPAATVQTPDPGPASEQTNSLGMRFLATPLAGVRFGMHEVRNSDFRAFRANHDSSPMCPFPANEDDQPVSNVSPQDADAFCQWLTARERTAGTLAGTEEIRLPSSHEWLVAAGVVARGAPRDGFYWGSEWPPPDHSGNFADEASWQSAGLPVSGIADYDDGHAGAAPVCSYPANENGLFDMYGNVWELCRTKSGKVLVLGGAWDTRDASKLRWSSVQMYQNPAATIGFRCVIAPVGPGTEPGTGNAAQCQPPPDEWEGVPLLSDENGTAALAALRMRPVAAGTIRARSTVGRPMADRTIAFPVVELRVTRPFQLAETEVTQALYELVMGDNPSSEQNPALPVDRVTWEEADSFCRRLTRFARSKGLLADGQAYVLPTETQWELACRAGEEEGGWTNRPTASELLACGWFAENADGHMRSPGGRTANPLGLVDLHGNVAEWCADWYDDAFPTDSRTDPCGPRSGRSRCVRGGSIDASAERCGPGARFHLPPGRRFNHVGFRVALLSTNP